MSRKTFITPSEPRQAQVDRRLEELVTVYMDKPAQGSGTPDEVRGLLKERGKLFRSPQRGRLRAAKVVAAAKAVSKR